MSDEVREAHDRDEKQQDLQRAAAARTGGEVATNVGGGAALAAMWPIGSMQSGGGLNTTP
ncbi:MAG: hypothetical protein ABEL76_09425 [Bradymonadaceae bacterium]